MDKTQIWSMGKHGGFYYISNGRLQHLWKDGTVNFGTGSTAAGCFCKAPGYWISKEEAQAVLDKFQPKHVWEHGDVFKTSWGITMIYLTPENRDHVFSLSSRKGLPQKCTGTCDVKFCLSEGTFLFNIKEKL